MTLKQALSSFKKLSQNNQLAHGYLFFGENRGQINNLVQQLPEIVLGHDSSRFFDFLIINGVSSGLKEILGLNQFIRHKPLVTKKIAIILNADKLTPEAQNALLKISEEPPPYAIFIMTVFSPDSILSTLASRFQNLYINSKVSTEDIKQSIAGPFIDRSLALNKSHNIKDDIKSIIEDLLGDEANAEELLDGWALGIIDYLTKSLEQNYKILRDFLFYWQNLNQFNLNQRLQIEVMLYKLARIN